MNIPRTLLRIIWPLVFSGIAIPVRGQQVSIPDAGLNAAVREELGKPAGPLTEQDLLNLTKLNADSRQIRSVEGLEAARNLRILNLGSNSLTSFPIAGSLTNLTNLDLSENHLTSLTLPADLSHLEFLDLSGNQLSSLTLPAGLTNLAVLFVTANQLTSLTLRPDMTRLTAFAGFGNPLVSFVLSELQAATNLAAVVTNLRNQGIPVTTYPLEPQLTPTRAQLIGAFRFDLAGPPGLYTIFSSTDLAEWDVLGNSNNQLGHILITDTRAQFSTRKFYRAELQTVPPNMVFIPPNTFTMGSPGTETGHQADEGPQTTVTLSRGFWMSKFLVTQGEYLAVTGLNPSGFPGDPNRPVEKVSWFAASDYCTTLTERDRAAGRIPPGTSYRLPTEAEWECAARAGTSTRFYYGDDQDLTGLTSHAWYGAYSGLTPRPVGQKLPNAFGLYDMAGNVWEWCQDWYGPYAGGTATDPQGPADNPIGDKVMRGGAWEASGFDCRSASRSFQGASPFITDFIIGFRVVLTFGQ